MKISSRWAGQKERDTDGDGNDRESKRNETKQTGKMIGVWGRGLLQKWQADKKAG